MLINILSLSYSLGGFVALTRPIDEAVFVFGKDISKIRSVRPRLLQSPHPLKICAQGRILGALSCCLNVYRREGFFSLHRLSDRKQSKHCCMAVKAISVTKYRLNGRSIVNIDTCRTKP